MKTSDAEEEEEKYQENTKQPKQQQLQALQSAQEVIRIFELAIHFKVFWNSMNLTLNLFV